MAANQPDSNDVPLEELVLHHAEAVELLRRLRVEPCCTGPASVSDVAARDGVSAGELMAAIGRMVE